MFRSEGNRLIFIGKAGDDFLPVAAALYNLAHKQGYQDVVLDFSKATYLDARFMLPLVTTARAYRSERVDFEIIEPEDQKSARLLQNTNWAHLIWPEKFEARDDRNVSHLSAIQYLNADDQFSAVDRSMDVILKSVGGLDRSRLKALEWSLNEITDNVLNHAESSVGGIVQVVTFPKKQLVEFYVCDAGIGIPRSLRQGRPQLSDDVSALRQAIEEGVTRNNETNQGNGLFGTFKCCQVSGGEFDVLSGYVALRHRPGLVNTSKNAIPFKGTFVRASINYGFEQLLEKALIFKGRSHSPSGDYIERVYETSTDEINFHVNKELSVFGSREAGRLARNKIENLMDRGRVAIVFDFSDIHLISSSFADEVFGKIFVELGPIKFGQLCKFSHVDGTVQNLIDRAIAQRMKQ
jgi:anti-sigma regulatory factor (Ser/Thr protein kinase)